MTVENDVILLIICFVLQTSLQRNDRWFSDHLEGLMTLHSRFTFLEQRRHVILHIAYRKQLVFYTDSTSLRISAVVEHNSLFNLARIKVISQL